MPDDDALKATAYSEPAPGTGVAAAARRPAPTVRLSGGSVHESLAGEIGLRIVRGDYPPGTVLPNEAQWAQHFDVSRSAVREAIKMLMAKSLLNSRPRIGSRVEPKERWNLLDRDVLGWYAQAPDLEAFLRTVQEFRSIIEPEASALTAIRRSPDELDEIERACADMGAARSLGEWTEADTRFHLAILRASGNDLLVPLGVLIESALRHLLTVTGSRGSDDLAQAYELHVAIVKAVRAGRPDAARRATRRLLGNTDKVIRRRTT